VWRPVRQIPDLWQSKPSQLTAHALKCFESNEHTLAFGAQRNSKTLSFGISLKKLGNVIIKVVMRPKKLSELPRIQN
jgi:hypothetical protein